MSMDTLLDDDSLPINLVAHTNRVMASYHVGDRCAEVRSWGGALRMVSPSRFAPAAAGAALR
jgi:hypothetical protein